MAWSKCVIEIAKTLANDIFNEAGLTDIGIIKDKSTTLEPGDGDTLEAKATGGEVVGHEVLEGTYTLKTRLIEPNEDIYTLLGLGAPSSSDFNVTTHIVDGDWSVRVTPKNVGARGIKVPVTNIAAKPGYSEEEGNYLDLEFNFLKGDQGYWYTRFIKAAPAATPAAGS